jgi:acetylornithine deacetylase
MKIDRDFLYQTLSDLVRINSINPTLVNGAPGERQISAYTAQVLNGLQLEVATYEPDPGRISVTGARPGSGGGKSLMFNAHYDTVGVEQMTDPFSAEIRDGRLYGRGAYDMKGSLAAQIAAVKALNDAGVRLRGDLIVAAVADEEYGSVGTEDLIRHVKTDAAVVTEPTAVQICLAHKGYLWIEVETKGRAAHGSRFDLGIDANMRMGRFLAQLDKLEQELRNRPPHPLVGPPSLHAAMLQGGEGLSTYSPSCRLQIERRTIPGETDDQAVAEIKGIVDQPDTVVKCFYARRPFEVSRDARIVRALDRASVRVLGRVPNYIGDTPWMDSALLAAVGIDTVVMGPGGGGAHAAVEWVELETVVQMAEILAETAVEYCG